MSNQIAENERLKASQWVSVETELPENDKDFLGGHRGPYTSAVGIACRLDKELFWISDLSPLTITHWQHLPSPPE